MVPWRKVYTVGEVSSYFEDAPLETDDTLFRGVETET